MGLADVSPLVDDGPVNAAVVGTRGCGRGGDGRVVAPCIRLTGVGRVSPYLGAGALCDRDQSVSSRR